MKKLSACLLVLSITSFTPNFASANICFQAEHSLSKCAKVCAPVILLSPFLATICL